MAKTVIAILASGRGSNAHAIYEAIQAGTISAQIAVVVSDNEAAPVLNLFRGYSIPVLCLDRRKYVSRDLFESVLADELDKHGVELVVLAGFMRILSPNFVRRYRGRIMNIHPSLLPAFPGLDAQGQAIRYGARVSGCTVHFVDEGMDTGPIILQQPVPVYDTDTATTLAARILHEEHRIYPEAVRLYSEGRLQIDGRQVFITR